MQQLKLNTGQLLKLTCQTARGPVLRLPCALLFFCKTFDKGEEPSLISSLSTSGSGAHSGAIPLQHSPAQGLNTSSSWSQVLYSPSPVELALAAWLPELMAAVVCSYITVSNKKRCLYITKAHRRQSSQWTSGGKPENRYTASLTVSWWSVA